MTNTETQGVFVSSADIYSAVQTVIGDVSIIKSELQTQKDDRKVERETAKDDSNRVRAIQIQIGAIWVVHGLIITYIVSRVTTS